MALISDAQIWDAYKKNSFTNINAIVNFKIPKIDFVKTINYLIFLLLLEFSSTLEIKIFYIYKNE